MSVLKIICQQKNCSRTGGCESLAENALCIIEEAAELGFFQFRNRWRLPSAAILPGSAVTRPLGDDKFTVTQLHI